MQPKAHDEERDNDGAHRIDEPPYFASEEGEHDASPVNLQFVNVLDHR
jgi:hypothetical protein